MKKSLLTENEMREIEYLDSLPYEEYVEHLRSMPINESTEQGIKKLDMTYDEFLKAYDYVDLTSLLQSFCINSDK